MLKTLNQLYRDRISKFSEEGHPRDDSGKFTSGGGSGDKDLISSLGEADRRQPTTETKERIMRRMAARRKEMETIDKERERLGMKPIFKGGLR